jgi:predicted MPP superfamily phosphohydrolase
MTHVVFPTIAALLFGLVYAWATASIPWCARHRRAVALSLLSVLACEIVARQLVLRAHTGSLVYTLATAVVMTLVLSALPIALLRGVSAIVGKLTAALGNRKAAPPAENAEPAGMSRRQMVEAAGGITLLGATGSMLGWGMARGRDAFEIDEIAVRIVGLPRALDGYVIAQISDIHTGDNVGERLLDEGFEVVRRAKADLLVVTGDMVDLDAGFAPLFARKLAAAAPRDGVFACLGNHDYYAGASQVAAVMSTAGVHMLVNDGLLIRPRDGGGFALLGVDDVGSRRYRGPGARLERALAKVPNDAARILLSHQPPTVDEWAGQVALQLSGHTHGGQINPLGLRPADLVFKYVAGQYQVGQTMLHVNRGFGTVGPPARVHAPPEVTRIVLAAA